jgi:hypothetical protein
MEIMSPYRILIDASLQYKDGGEVSSRLTLPEGRSQPSVAASFA